ncbi:MAG: hypothetical protein QOH59_529 [Gemmatimonadales bacterium]|jgi:hypothetical protein|nr:hypothetical protein [Gemmatimonadales bacterium]
MTAVLALLLGSPASAQSSPWIRLGANGVLLYTFADPVPHGRSLAEVRLVQPAFMLHGGALSNRLRLLATVNLEGLTIPDGELTPGAWGEGFIDRRHPHTYLHELVLSADDLLGQLDGSARLSLAAGKGFAPFGTDDPMVRPVVRYPVNHHLAQVLERAVVIAGITGGPVVLEAGLFNGDEPERPGQWPKVSRFGDSWSGRLTVVPVRELELQGSYAHVHSPEHRPGAGTDQRKWSVAGRWDGAVRAYPVYGLVEWARTSEAEGFFVFRSFLAEGAWTAGRSRLHYRFERTERPEEERTLDPFRSVRPHFENSIQGTTRWTIHTVGYGFRLDPVARLEAVPFAEVSYGRITDVGGGVFDASRFYGRSSFWSLGIGVRLNAGMRMHRMGRYGVAQDTAGLVEKGHHERHAD